MMKYSKPRGTQDVLPPAIHTWLHVEDTFESVARSFAYEPVRTPIFESTDLFLRSVGEGTDIVSKEMYTFVDRGGRSLTLRPENTASVIRAYLENGMHRLGGVQRLSYVGPMFRYDRPQAGRYRQFHQIGVEAIGTLSAMVDAEVIDLVITTLERLGFGELVVKLNSVGCPVCREPYTERLKAALRENADRLCDDCRERAETNPLRVFDCKRCTDIKKDLPAISDYLCEECSGHFSEVKACLTAIGIIESSQTGERRQSFEHDRELVRGLDYYTKTTFEILHSSLGAQSALCGGGRYDNLVEQCGGPPTPAVGFSAGIERIVSVLPDEQVPQNRRADVYLMCIDEESAARTLGVARALRSVATVEVDATFRGFKKQLKGAEKSGARAVVIVDSSAPQTVAWKDMETRKQDDVADGEVLTFAKRRLAGQKGDAK